MSNIKFYLIDYPADYVKGTLHKIRKSILNKCREMVYNYEFNEVLNHKIKGAFYHWSEGTVKL